MKDVWEDLIGAVCLKIGYQNCSRRSRLCFQLEWVGWWLGFM